MDGPFYMRERVEGSPTQAMPVGLVRPFTVRFPSWSLQYYDESGGVET